MRYFSFHLILEKKSFDTTRFGENRAARGEVRITLLAASWAPADRFGLV